MPRRPSFTWVIAFVFRRPPTGLLLGRPAITGAGDPGRALCNGRQLQSKAPPESAKAIPSFTLIVHVTVCDVPTGFVAVAGESEVFASTTRSGSHVPSEGAYAGFDGSPR
jgi:hypothetical protein